MASRGELRIPGWLPLVGAIAVIAVLVGLLWVNLPTAGQTAENTAGNTAAESAPQEKVQTPPTATAMPEPTPSVVTPAGTTPAPDFQGIVRWLNSEPLSMEEQRGKVVLIDFWTYS